LRDAVGFHLDIYVVAVLGLALLGTSYGLIVERARVVPGTGYGSFILGVALGLLGEGDFVSRVQPLRDRLRQVKD
jgi:hypothetical protein